MQGSGDTIFALSSGAGRAGIAVIRLSGQGTAAAFVRLAGHLPAPRRATVRRLCRHRDGLPIDQALVLWLPGPASYTGEDMAELHVHGGRAVVELILVELGQGTGLRLADPGEFTRRAFLNGKLDLTAAEGVADLIDAETEAQRRQAMRQYSGALRSVCDSWRLDLIEAMALVEAAIDFSDEGDVPADVMAPIRPRLIDLCAAMAAHLGDGRRGEILRDGYHVMLAGAPNAGKSSLLNALAQRDAAIVSAEPGTTRDIIEVRLDLDGLPVVLSDTAGIRDPQNAIEREGIRRTLELGQSSDLIVWVGQAGIACPAAPPSIAAADTRVLWLLNKFDLVVAGAPQSSGQILTVATAQPSATALTAPGDTPQAPLLVSALTGFGLEHLVGAIARMARDRIGDMPAPALTRTRHRLELARSLAALETALAGDPADLELRAEDLRLAATALGRMTGRVDVEDILDRIFSTFCIGK